MKQFINENGITIKELKELVKNLPEENDKGEPYEVWVSTGRCLSSPCFSITPLNVDNNGSDILFGYIGW